MSKKDSLDMKIFILASIALVVVAIMELIAPLSYVLEKQYATTNSR